MPPIRSDPSCATGATRWWSRNSAGEPAGIAARDDGSDYISDLWVAPHLEGRGVGSALLLSLEEAIARQGHGRARLEVLTSNVRAFALYRRRGYRPVWEGFKRDPTLGIELHKTGMAKTLALAPAAAAQ